jgi:hypothetical protein
VTNGEEQFAGVTIVSGVDPARSYDGETVPVRVTVNLGDHIFRDQPAQIVVIGVAEGQDGRSYASAYLPRDVAITFRNDYPNGEYYEWSPERGRPTATRMLIRSGG